MDSSSRRMNLSAVAIAAYMLSFAVVAVVFVVMPINDPDFWWHLKTGQWIAAARHLPDVDPFNLREAARAAFDKELTILQGYWLWQVVAYGFFALAGFAGISLMKGLILAGTCAFAVLFFRRAGVRLPIALPVLTASLVVFQHFYFLERPQIATFVFLMLLVGFFVDIYRGERPSWWLYPVMALWGNLHPAVIVGVPMLILYTLGAWWDYRGDPARRRAIVSWCGIGVACSFLNPGGIDLYTVTFATMTRGVAISGIVEYEPTLSLLAKDKFVIIVLVLLAVHFLCLWRVARVRSLAFWLVSLYLAVNCLQYARNIAFVGIALVPMTGFLLEKSWETLGAGWRRAGRWLYVFGGVAAVCYGILIIDQVRLMKQRGDWGPVSHIYPQAMVAFLQSQQLQGNIFNSFDWGGYFVWELFPQYRMFIDGRGYDEERYADYGKINYASRELRNGRYEFLSLLDEYNIDIVISKNEVDYTAVSPLLKYLLNEPAWVPVYQDKHGYILLRGRSENSAFLQRHRIDKLVFLNRMIGSYDQYLRENPRDEKRWLGRGELLGYVGRYDEAARDFAMVKQLNPDNPFLPAKVSQLEKLRQQAQQR